MMTPIILSDRPMNLLTVNFVVFVSLAFAGMVVGQETSEVLRVYHVDSINGDDSNTGKRRPKTAEGRIA
ncbi:MAG TPA: hypothetical protein EYG38_16310 [Verrucomicrobia bacterium]|nr:hypothetical protein [Verrucomicrobiota bacterium]